jgi:hypothetical protein
MNNKEIVRDVLNKSNTMIYDGMLRGHNLKTLQNRVVSDNNKIHAALDKLTDTEALIEKLEGMKNEVLDTIIKELKGDWI